MGIYLPKNITKLHDPKSDFKDSCGFALLAHMDGEKSHWLVQTTLESLSRLTHRGAVAADGKSGDGCGIMLQFPEPFLRDVAQDCGFKLSDRFASGLVFFSPDDDLIRRGQKILTRHLGRSALDVAQEALAKVHSHGVLARQGGRWKPTNWRSYAANVRAAGKSLMALGVASKGSVSILGFRVRVLNFLKASNDG